MFVDNSMNSSQKSSDNMLWLSTAKAATATEKRQAFTRHSRWEVKKDEMLELTVTRMVNVSSPLRSPITLSTSVWFVHHDLTVGSPWLSPIVIT